MPLPDTHLLALPRPLPDSQPDGAIDTTTLAAHDFDVDNRTGFMPPHPPLARLPLPYSIWDDLLSCAQDLHLALADSEEGRGEDEKRKSEGWRERVRSMGLVPTKDLARSELALRRAHHVLAWILHFYVHTLPKNSSEDIIIPRSLALPLLRVCAQLQLPPVLTYSDNVLYNWTFDHDLSPPPDIPTPSTPLRCQTLFTQTKTESVFYLVAAQIELIGVRALDLMRATMDELFVGDEIAVRRITDYLVALESVIRRMKGELMGMKEQGCDPDTFFNTVRPWLKGCEERKWVFEGLDDEQHGEEEEQVWQPAEISGPSAGQSAIIHALDIFLGVDKWSHSVAPGTDVSFLTRMRQYMPRHHRHFLRHLETCSTLREFVLSFHSEDEQLAKAYNAAITALKEFRDAHLIVVALFIVGPAAKARRKAAAAAAAEEKKGLKGTGGTDIVQFLKTVRDQTKSAVV